MFWNQYKLWIKICALPGQSFLGSTARYQYLGKQGEDLKSGVASDDECCLKGQHHEQLI